MKQTGFIKGDSSEAKFASIERALQRISRRTTKKVGVDIPPIPVSCYMKEAEDDGTIMRYMFPSKGIVEKAIIWAEEFPEDLKRIPLVLDISDYMGKTAKNLEITPTLNSFDVQMEVVAGSRFELRLTDPETKLFRIWASFLYQIEPKQAKLQEMLIEKVDQLSQGFME